ncbi:GAF domain-containing protein [Klebsiella pneumoniae]|nr:GAF domain-containing protein [Klebsiella pneumoniae]
MAKEIHRYLIDAISAAAQRPQGKLNIYLHALSLTPATRFTTRARWMKPAPLTERVFKAKRCCCLICTNMTLSRRMRKCSSRCGGNKIQTLCLLPLMSGNTLLGVLKLAQCDEQVFTHHHLKLLRQIAERVSIAIDNALAYREIQRLERAAGG